MTVTFAVFVLGPISGSTLPLQGDPNEWLVATQPALRGITNARDSGMVIASAPVHRYERVGRPRLACNSEYVIFEYAGLVRR